ncbi:hypothetical protein ACIPMZ_15950 [Scandinavium goeteborgense]|uniref:hypothetical protein n=1 Tax=Scandinavium goeteborgense TaxID=1851514 RepID=UPI00381898E6
MTATKLIALWLTELASLTIIYGVLCFLLPDLELYGYYVEKFGFVLEQDWLDWYTLIVLLTAIILNCILIGCVFMLFKKRGTRKECSP